MSKLAELLAAEKTPNGAWNQLQEDTVKKFKNPTTFFDGHSKSLSMIEDNAGNTAIQDQAREEKPVTTTVYDTIDYALSIFARAEDLQYQKNLTNQRAVGTVMWNGEPLLKDMPIDELLGLEARLTKIRAIYGDMPTLDASKHWQADQTSGAHIWVSKFPEETTKTEKHVVPIIMSPATKEHPAQVQPVSKDIVVGKFTMIRRSGAATAVQKSEAIKRVDELLIAIKQARMRANETEVQAGSVAAVLVPLLLEPLLLV